MSDRLTLEHGKATVTTEEGRTFEAPEAAFNEVLAAIFRPPLGGLLLPDGVKALYWSAPYLGVVHQLPPMCRTALWITDDSPADFGPGTKYRKVQLSFPYAITFATFVWHRGALHLTKHNELYFSNQPIRSEDDPLCFPALLNVSCIVAPNRTRSWVCTQNLEHREGLDWCSQIHALLEHTWNGAFNRSSERHEGESMYRFSQGIHAELHPVERWQEASRRNRAFALEVPWKPAPLKVGELARTMLEEQAHDPALSMLGMRMRRAGVVQQVIRRLQKASTSSG
jgi:hypothetical protein